MQGQTAVHGREENGNLLLRLSGHAYVDKRGKPATLTCRCNPNKAKKDHGCGRNSKGGKASRNYATSSADASAPAFQIFGSAYLPWKLLESDALAQVMSPPAPTLSTAETTSTMANVITTGTRTNATAISGNDGCHAGGCGRDSTNHGSHDLSHVSSVGHRSGGCDGHLGTESGEGRRTGSTPGLNGCTSGVGAGKADNA